jgi:hypothetical protein
MQAQLANDPDFQYLAVDRVKLLKEQTKEFDGKKMCWIPDHKEGFLKAEIQSTWLMVFNATFNNILAISWVSV